MDPAAPQQAPYSKRPLWQWLVLYLVLAVVLYGLLYYLVLGKRSTPPAANLTMTPTPTMIVTPTITVTPSVSPKISGTPTITTTKIITVTGSEFAFVPATIAIKKGQPVQLTFKNIGKYPHNWTVSALNLKTPTIQPGTSTTITFTPTQTGNFTYECTVPGHADRGMKGTLTVQ